ncbi:MAG: rhodanese-like domain-containing protein [Fibrobacteres bacterium]|nr:rhodanese-like domain-containing protein [Fibrobacterota bacterium]
MSRGISLSALLLALALPSAPGAQALSRSEKLEGKLRVAMLKANKDIQGPWIKAAELKTIIDDTNLILVDVRQPAERKVSMLPHAIDTYQFADQFRHGIPPGKRLVLYCTIGYRSGKYGEKLAPLGIKYQVLEGGILMWSFVGGPLVERKDNFEWAPTKRIHVYDAEWNIVHPDYVAVLP